MDRLYPLCVTLLMGGLLGCTTTREPMPLDLGTPVDAAQTDADDGGIDDAGACSPNLNDDFTNCGVCGHACVRGMCLDGVCQAYPIQNSLYFTSAIAVGGDDVFAASEAIHPSVGKVRSDGAGGWQMVIPSTSVVGAPYTGLVVDGSTLYAINNHWGIICAVPTNATNATCTNGIVTGLSNAGQLKIDGDTLYFVDAQGLQRVPKTGGTPTRVTSTYTAEPVAYAIVGSSIYLLEDNSLPIAEDAVGKLMRLDATQDAAPETLVTDLYHPRGLAVDATHVYFSNVGVQLAAGSPRFPVLGDIRKLDRTTLAVTTVIADRYAPFFLAVDDKHVYWGSPEAEFPGAAMMLDAQDGSVFRIAKAPAATDMPQLVSTGHHFPGLLTVSGDSLYFVDTYGQGALYRVIR